MTYFRQVHIPEEILGAKNIESGSGSIIAREKVGKQEIQDGIDDYFYVQDSFKKELRKIITEITSYGQINKKSYNKIVFIINY